MGLSTSITGSDKKLPDSQIPVGMFLTMFEMMWLELNMKYLLDDYVTSWTFHHFAALIYLQILTYTNRLIEPFFIT